MDNLIYLKTTETCNLNCKHCFTSGTNGRKIYWDVDKVSDWLTRFHKKFPNNNIHFEFHGGEPFLADIQTMIHVHKVVTDLWETASCGCTSNLVFKITPEHLSFIQNQLNNRIATSWDPDIRFENIKQYDLWRKNVEFLIDNGVSVKLNISVSTGVVQQSPIDLLEWATSLGFESVAFERITMNGNARKNSNIVPDNIDVDAWFFKMHQQTKEYTLPLLTNEYLESVYDKFKGITNSGTFCRDCEQKLFTLNADGTIGGCPNSSPEQNFGDLSMEIDQLLTSETRIENISCEVARDPRCYSCSVFQYCNSECHQLEWQGDICPAPKTLMKHLSPQNRVFMMQVQN
jgi:radical SAM protein with 4Fe4S-binding SPASM domain